MFSTQESERKCSAKLKTHEWCRRVQVSVETTHTRAYTSCGFRVIFLLTSSKDYMNYDILHNET